MKKLLLATAAVLAISTNPAAALNIDKISFPTNEIVVVILSDIPERAKSVTCVLDDGEGKNVAVETDYDPDVVHQMIFLGVKDDPDGKGNAENITCWLGRDHSTKVARWLMDVNHPPMKPSDIHVEDLPKE